MALWPFTFTASPLLNYIAVNGAVILDAKTNLTLCVGVAVTLCLSRVGCLAYSYVSLFLINFLSHCLQYQYGVG